MSGERIPLPDLPAMPQIVIGQHQCHHGFANGHGADADTGVVAAFCGDFGFGAISIDGFARCSDGRGWFDGKACDHGLAGGDPAQYAACFVGEKVRSLLPARIWSAFCSPDSSAASKPAPISTAFTALMLIRPEARS